MCWMLVGLKLALYIFMLFLRDSFDEPFMSRWRSPDRLLSLLRALKHLPISYELKSILFKDNSF